MNTIASNGNGGRSGGRTYEFVPGTGYDSGFYERSADVYLYDLMGNLPDPGEGVDALAVPDKQDDDVLVASAAWAVLPDKVQTVEQWLERIKLEPPGWLTPWRAGEPSLEADLWLDSPAAGAPPSRRFLIAKLDNPYLPGMLLRVSLDRAVERFEDLRRSLEQSWRERMSFLPDRATRSWLDHLDALEGPDEEDEEDEE